MDLRQDFKDLLELFNSNKVDFMIVGAYALAFYGAPRLTGDMDIWVRPSNENAERVLKSLDEFGFPLDDLSTADFVTLEKSFNLVFHRVALIF
ncbi:MAG: hypothetical protein IPP40_08180 [bacterium]|nr:hypothetical protein [bacterium]